MAIDRIQKRFAALKKQKRTALIPFLMAGDPDIATSIDYFRALADNGADLIEVGMPFSDPMADGPAIQRAGKRALSAHTKLAQIFELVALLRKDYPAIPIILMGYFNMVLQTGLVSFAKRAQDAGVDGLIIVDLPPEEDQALFDACTLHDLALIKLITPTTTEARLKTILQKAQGFLYYVTVAGITGTRSASADSIKQAIHMARKHTDLPIVAGFGIKTAEQIREIAAMVDGAVVGSALVNHVEAHPKPSDKKTVATHIATLMTQLHGACG